MAGPYYVRPSPSLTRMSQTAYLDTANWFDLARGTIPGSTFQDAVQSGAIQPVLSLLHIIEFAQTPLEARAVVTAYVQSLINGGRAVWIKSLPHVAKAELRQALLKFLQVDPGAMSIYTSSFIDTLPPTVRGLDLEKARTYTIDQLVSAISRTWQFRRHELFRRTQALTDMVRLQLYKLRERPLRTPRESEYVTAVLEDMPRAVVTQGGIQIDILPGIRQDFLSQLNWKDCPAIALRIALMRGWARSSDRPAPSDFGDLFHIAAPIAYCDVAFADKRIHAALQRGNAHLLPRKNAQFAEWCSGLQLQA